MMVSSKTASSSWASMKVDPDNTVFLNIAPFMLAFSNFTRSSTAFVKSVPVILKSYNFKKGASFGSEKDHFILIIWTI
jgi:hypothetical protein